MSTLAQLIDRTQAFLYDDATNFTDAIVTEALRHALDEYTQVSPLVRETVLTLIADGREIALSDYATLLSVVDVWYPYDSAQTWNQAMRPNWQVWWDDARAVLHLIDDYPIADEEVRLWYSVPHTIENLDSGSITSTPIYHESLLVLGAAGWSAFIRSIDLSETTGVSAVSTPNYAAIATRYLKMFRARLEMLRGAPVVGGVSVRSGFVLDKWEGSDG